MKKVTLFFLAATMIAGTGYAKGDTLKDVDEDEFKRLKDLGLVKEYDSETDGVVKGDEDCSKLEEEVQGLKDTNAQLEEEVKGLKGFVDEAITLPKGQVPNGYEKA